MKDGYMQVAVDAVVFTIKHDQLQILLIKRKYDPFKGKYALPGGFVHPDEGFEDGVKRELEEETGVKNIFLKQLAAFGDPKRDPRGRVLSIAFLALINHDQKLRATTDAAEAVWHPLDNHPPLGFDHREILAEALEHLRYEIQTTNIAYQILPKKFTLTQMQKLYEAVLEKKLDKRNFRKRLRELAILESTGETHMEGAHRPALLYKFKDRTYKHIKDKIHVFV